jgi:hypothetical protein
MDSCEWLAKMIGDDFRKWLDTEFPDGMGTGNGLSWWNTDDMEAAYRAGYDQRAAEC